MEHHHHHHVHPTPDMQKLNRSFIVGIVLNIVFVLAEAGAGFYYDSLALLSDAGHNLLCNIPMDIRKVPYWFRY